jgi:hypothetical protein
VKDIVSLVPPTYDFKQYDLYTGGGIQLLGTLKFNDSEIIAVEITYLQSVEFNASNAGMYDAVVLIAGNTTLTNTHRNKRLKCEGNGSTLEITLEALSAVPTGKFYYFNSNGGTQKKARILCGGSDKVRYRGVDISEISIGKGEHVRLEKYDTGSGMYWEAVDAHHGIAMVGERVMKGMYDTTNLLPEDGSYVDGDVEPRLYAYVAALPSGSKISTSADLSSSYTHPTGEEGKFAINTTLRQLRMPNTQGWYIKGADTFTSLTVTGVTAQGQVGPHTHPMSAAYKNDSAGGDQPNTMYFGTDKGATPFGAAISTDVNSGTTTEVNHVKDIFLRRT